MPDFPGFSQMAVGFLDGLSRTNTREYFEKNRGIYEEQVLAPARLLVTAVGDALRAAVSPGVRSVPRVGQSLFRINRDLRFSTDKTPYRPWVDIIWWEGGDSARDSPAFMFRFASDHLVVGAGIMGMSGPTLARYRAAVDDAARGEALAAGCRRRRAPRPRRSRSRCPGRLGLHRRVVHPVAVLLDHGWPSQLHPAGLVEHPVSMRRARSSATGRPRDPEPTPVSAGDPGQAPGGEIVSGAL